MTTDNTHNDNLLIWASRCQAVAFNPTATTIWMSLALQILPLVNNTPQSAAVTTNNNLLDHGNISNGCLLGSKIYPSSVMSTQQAKPYIALAQVLQAVTVQLCKATTMGATGTMR